MGRLSPFVFTLICCASALKLTVLHSNDVHSHLSDEYISMDASLMEVSTESNKPIRVTVGGYPRYVTAFAKLKASNEAANRSVLKLHAGDAITGTSYWGLFKGTADASMMEHLCFDAFTLGNHEFDEGDKVLADFIFNLQSTSCPCPVLAANVEPASDSPLQGKLLKSKTFTLNGVEVGVIGIDIKTKTMQSSSPSAGTTLTDEKVAAQAEIDSLTAAGVKHIILLTHIGYSNDLAWMATLNGVDVIIGGDSHSLLGDSHTSGVSSIAGDYPTEATNGDGKKVCVATAWEYSKALGVLHVDFDADGHVTTCGGMPVFAYDTANMQSGRRRGTATALESSDLEVVTAYLDTLGGQFMAAAEDADTLTTLQGYTDQVATLKLEKIADVPETLCFDRFPGQGRSTLCTANDTQAQGGAACQLVAQAFMTMAKSADFGIQNAGGCRTDIAAGDFSHDDAYTMLPFSNMLVYMEMTGAQIKALLEDGIDFGLDPEGSSGAYPYAAGLRYDVNCAMEKGSRVSNLEMNPRLAGEWTPIGDATYKIVTNNYISGGKDGYTTFLDVANTEVNSFINYAEGLAGYCKDVGTLVQPPLNHFSTQAYTDSDGVSHGAGARSMDAATADVDSASRHVLDIAVLMFLVAGPLFKQIVFAQN